MLRGILTPALLLAFAGAVPMAMAADPLGAGSGIVLDRDDLDLSLGDYDTNPYRSNARDGGQAEVQLGHSWGLKGSLYSLDSDDTGDEVGDSMSVDLKRRVFSAADNKFLAVGLGWGNIDFENGDRSAGPRFVLEGQFRLGSDIHLYGQTAWLPTMDDVAGRTDVAGREVEAGLSFQPDRSFSLRAGVRRFSLDFIDDTGTGDTTESTGFVLGGGFHW